MPLPQPPILFARGTGNARQYAIRDRSGKRSEAAVQATGFHDYLPGLVKLAYAVVSNVEVMVQSPTSF